VCHSYLVLFYLCLCLDVLDNECTVKYNIFCILVFFITGSNENDVLSISNSSFGEDNKLILQIERLTILHNFKHGIKPGTYLIETYNYVVLSLWFLLL
jgi:hypothetical protein